MDSSLNNMTQQQEKSKKAVISNRIFIDVDNSQLSEIDAKLTYKIPSYNPLLVRPTIIKNCRKVTKSVISIPSGRVDLIPSGHTVIDKRIEVPIEWPRPKFDLYPNQFEAAMELGNSGILNAKPGWGKTFTALHVAHSIGQRTLVVVHNLSLRTQWEKEIFRLFGFKPGVIGSGQFNIHPIITVANVQTLNNYISQLDETFGLLILDEAHHVPATTFSNVVDKMKCKYKLGLTGTLQRKDGKHLTFCDFFGLNVVKPEQSNIMLPKVQIIKSEVQLPPASCWADKITALLEDPEYINLVAMVAKAKADIGHKVLIVSDRKRFQRKLEEILGDRSIVVDGDTSLEDRDKAHKMIHDGKKDILIGTVSIYKEGISEAPLSCLIPATVINNESLLEQLVGRIMRIYPDKKQPVVIDIQLKKTPGSNTVYKQSMSRLATYMKLGYKIEQL